MNGPGIGKLRQNPWDFASFPCLFGLACESPSAILTRFPRISEGKMLETTIFRPAIVGPIDGVMDERTNKYTNNMTCRSA